MNADLPDLALAIAHAVRSAMKTSTNAPEGLALWMLSALLPQHRIAPSLWRTPQAADRPTAT